MAEPIVNPELPYVGEVPSGLQPGKMVRFQGVTHRDSDRFNINLSTGPNFKPRDDTSLHLSVRLNQGYIARNSYKNGTWGDEQGNGKLPIGQGESFEIIILCTPDHYKIAVNGQHFCEFPYRIPYDQVTNLLIDGDVAMTLVSFEGIPLPGNETATQASPVHSQGPQYGPPPGQYGGYAPPMPPGAQPQSQAAGFFDQAQDILAGAIKSGAAEKLLSSIMSSGGQQQPQGYAHQNARYGIYPDLPTQDNTQVPQSQDSSLSNVIAGSGGTITSGPQPTVQTQSTPQNPGPIEGLLMGLLSGKKSEDGQNVPAEPNRGGDVLSGLLSSLMSNQGQQSQGQNVPSGPQGQQQQTQGGDLLSGLLSSLTNPQGQGQQSAPPGQNIPAEQQSKGSDVLSGILSSLMNSQHQGQQPQAPPGQQQSQGGDLLSGLLSSLTNPQGQGQPSAPPGQNVPAEQQSKGSDVLSGILSSLLNPSPQGQQPTPGQGSVQAGQQGQGNDVLSGGQNPAGQSQQNNVEMLTGLLQGLMSKAREQQESTRPIQETHPAQDPQQQYGQYPHPPQQEQKGPMESLLSGFLSGGGGGGQQQQQQPHIGGEPSVGGLGSMGGILGSLAGSLLHRPDHNQGH